MGVLVAIHTVGGVRQIAGNFEAFLAMVPVSLLIMAPAFVFHELGHKVMAQKFGFWAEYRMWVQGLLLAVLFTMLGFLFIAPGAVYFAPHGMSRGSLEKVGKIGLSGPIINLFLGVAFGLFAVLGVGEFWTSIASVAARINAFLAIFNLLPFAPLDGEKIFKWDKKAWGGALVLAVALFLSLGSLISNF